MTIVNTNMLRHEKTPVDNILKALSWDDIPEEYRDDCRDIAVRAALALLRQFERARTETAFSRTLHSSWG